ncbi:MAG: alpha/beta hydrolase [Pseudomonadota bacterium]|nr:alpha/beta hydrolase [Pseudomonadota bacterium]
MEIDIYKLQNENVALLRFPMVQGARPFTITGFWGIQPIAASPLVRVAFLLLYVLGLAGCAGRPLMPTPNLYASAGREPFTAVGADQRSTRIDLLYVTDRAPERDEQGNLGYGHERSRSMAFGSATIQIGEEGTWEALARDSGRHKRSEPWDLQLDSVRELGRFPPTPLPFTIEDGRVVRDASSLQVQAHTEEALRSEIVRRLSMTPEKEVIVYVHGYNNDFDDAAFTLAELWHFAGREGVPLLYTWPAGRGGLTGYAYDRESGEFTIFHLKQLLRALSRVPEIERIHLLAHSRGSDVTLSAVRELAIEARASGVDPRTRYRIANLILAAPDMDVEVLGQRVIAEGMGAGPDLVTIYASRGDRALGLAEKLFGSVMRLGRAREGSLPPDIVNLVEKAVNVSVVESRVRTGLIGHGYFHSDPAASSDLILVIRDRRRPGAEHGRPLKPAETNLWVLEDGYPALPKP